MLETKYFVGKNYIENLFKFVSLNSLPHDAIAHPMEMQKFYDFF